MTCTTSLSIYSTLSPPSNSRANTSSSSSSCSSSSSSFSSSVPVFVALRTKPTCPFVRGTRFSYFEGPKRVRKRTNFGIKSKDMTITEIRPEEEEEYPPLLDPENNSRPRRIALFVEPSPFAYVSGYKNRFQNFIRYLREMGDEVMVVTTHEGVPEEFYGAKLIGSRSFPCPLYQKVPLSLALSPRIISEVARFKPDIIHASSPGIMVFGALIIAKLLCVPIVMSYHTHVPVYIPRYTFSWLVRPMWLVIKFLHRAADLTLVPSAAIQKDLQAERVAADNKIRLWNKGVDSESFHPRFRSHEMRIRLSNGEPEKPLIVHVGRIGVEKSLDFLKSVMDSLPEARIAFIGDGPYRGA
uniref:Glycosyltransferase subfamily 4-like N-terminal domain-containing protein n=1 Tax=Cannabis sativa TaxID=3483 RepID=A0A803QG22_CANSA